MILSVCDDDDNILKHCIIPCTLPSPFICKSHWSCVNHQKVVHKLQVIIPSSTWFALGPPLRRCLDWPPTKHCIGRLLCFVVCVRRSWAKGVYNNMQWSNKLDGGGPVVGDNIVMVGHNHSVPMLELETSLHTHLLSIDCCVVHCQGWFVSGEFRPREPTNKYWSNSVDGGGGRRWHYCHGWIIIVWQCMKGRGERRERVRSATDIFSSFIYAMCMVA